MLATVRRRRLGSSMKHHALGSLLWAGTTALVLTVDGHAAAEASANADDRLKALEQELQDVKSQLADLKRADPSRNATRESGNPVRVKLDNGRPTFASADGDFSAAIRALVQFDWGTYMQSASAAARPAAFGPDLSSGTNFRRVYLGIQGKAFGNWSYNANFDFGGSGGTESPGHIQSVYVQFDGLAPFASAPIRRRRISKTAPRPAIRSSSNATRRRTCSATWQAATDAMRYLYSMPARNCSVRFPTQAARCRTRRCSTNSKPFSGGYPIAFGTTIAPIWFWVSTART